MKKKREPVEEWQKPLYKIPYRNWELICKWCCNRKGRQCTGLVPWFAVSIYCDFWLEHPAEPEKPKTRRKLSDSALIRKIIKKSLVETF